MKQFDPLEIQKNIEEKRLILGEKVQSFLLNKLLMVSDAISRLFAAKNTAFIGSLVIFLISILVRSKRDIGPESALYLEIAQKIFSGGKYYQDFFDFNLPLSYIFTLIPLLFAKLLNVSTVICSEIFVNLLGLGTIYFSAKILQRTEIKNDRVFYNLIILSFAAGFFLRIFTLQFNEFATKSTYFLVFAYPYICLQLLKNNQLRKSDQLLIGFLAAMLCCLKAHYVILVLACEIRRFVREKLQITIFFEIRNVVFFLLIVLYSFLIFLCFPEYFSTILTFAPLYFDTRFSGIIFPIKEDIYPLLLLLVTCYFLCKKFVFLELFFLISAVFCLVPVLELSGFYDQRVLLYSLSLPLILLIILSLIRDQQINWKRDFLVLLVILVIPQFDRSFFIEIALNVGTFWWILVFVMRQKWNKSKLNNAEWQKLSLLRYIFLPREQISWTIFSLLTIFTIKMAATSDINNLAWLFSAVIFILEIHFYHNLHQKISQDKKLSLMTTIVIFLVLSYFLSLQIKSIFNSEINLQSESLKNRIAEVTKINSTEDENYIFVSGINFGNYPQRFYLDKPNPISAANLSILYSAIQDNTNLKDGQNLLLRNLKSQISDKKNKLFLVENFEPQNSHSCEISFLEFYFKDEEFRTLFLENFAFLDRIIMKKKEGKKVDFYNEEEVKTINKESREILIRDIEVYVRK